MLFTAIGSNQKSRWASPGPLLVPVHVHIVLIANFNEIPGPGPGPGPQNQGAGLCTHTMPAPKFFCLGRT